LRVVVLSLGHVSYPDELAETELLSRNLRPRDEEDRAVRRRTMVLYLAMCATLLTLTVPACSYNASTAEISEATMARDPDGEHPTKVFSPDDRFWCVVYLSSAPDDTKVRTVWTAVDVEGMKPAEEIGRVPTISGSGERLPFSLGNDNPWLAGDYKVDLYLNDAKNPTKTLKFEVH
jgi:hypothetical protein